MSDENFDKMILAVANAICYISKQETQDISEHFSSLESTVSALVKLLQAKKEYGIEKH